MTQPTDYPRAATQQGDPPNRPQKPTGSREIFSRAPNVNVFSNADNANANEITFTNPSKKRRSLKINPFGIHGKSKPIKIRPSQRLSGKKECFMLSTGRKIAIKAMADAGISIGDISKAERISYEAVRKIVEEFQTREFDPNIVDKTQSALRARFALLADKAMDFASDEVKLDKLNAYQLAAVAGIAVDKFRLLSGLSTQNVDLVSVHGKLTDSLADLAELKKKVASAIDVEPIRSDNQGNG